jgi:hypothetical protein
MEAIMPTDRSYVATNDASRTRLRALVGRLSDADLTRPMPAGWTVASVLAHVAFWDQRILALVETWETAGLAAVPRLEQEADVDWINDATKPLLLALAPRRAAEVTLAIAEATDARVAALSDAFVARNAEAGGPLNLHRSQHRLEHLDEIDRALIR